MAKRTFRSVPFKVLATIVVALAAGFLATSWPPITWGIAAFASGVLVGFLFGIPRVQQLGADFLDGDGSSRSRPYRQSVNTNLEGVSDWLTKIVVGVGLVHLYVIPEAVQSVATFLAGADYSPGWAGAILVSFSVAGFLSGYLTTRLKLAKAFSEADQAACDFNAGVSIATEHFGPASRIPIPISPEPPFAEPPSPGRPLEPTVPAPQFSPRAAVLDAWNRLYMLSQQVLERVSPTGRPRMIAATIINQLAEAHVLTQEEQDLFRQLKALRDTAVHASDAGLTYGAAMEYLRLAGILEHSLRAALDRGNGTDASNL